MFIYQPCEEACDRIVWYGGESTQLHYEVFTERSEWIELSVRTLGGGIPIGVGALHAEMVDYYNDCNAGITMLADAFMED
jgi:hypothetical protein